MLYRVPEYMGIFGLSWKEKVSNKAAPGSGWSTGNFNRNFDLLFGTYKIAVGQKKYLPYDRNNPDAGLFSYIANSTGIEYGKVISFLNALYDVTKAGDIDPAYLNPAQGQAVKTEQAQDTAETIKRFLMPAGAVVKSGPISSIVNKILVAGAAVTAGYFIIPKLIKGRKSANKN